MSSLTHLFNTIGSMAESEAAKQLTNNPNAKPVGQQKNRKAKKQKEKRASEQEAMFNFFERLMQPEPRTVRRTISGRVEDPNALQGLDWLEKNGPDRDRVALRQQSLRAQSLANPARMAQIQNDFEVNKQNKEAWDILNPKPPQQSQLDFLRTPTNRVDVVTDPRSDRVNPRTGLVTNEGDFMRVMGGKYGTGTATFKMPGSENVPAAGGRAPAPVQGRYGSNEFVGPPNMGEEIGPMPQGLGGKAMDWMSNRMSDLRKGNEVVADFVFGDPMSDFKRGAQVVGDWAGNRVSDFNKGVEVFNDWWNTPGNRSDVPASRMPPPNNFRPQPGDEFGQRPVNPFQQNILGPQNNLQPMGFDLPPSPPRGVTTFPTQVSAQPMPNTVQAPNLSSMQELFGLAPPPPSQFQQSNANQFMFPLPEQGNMMRLPISIQAPNLTQAQQALAQPQQQFNLNDWISDISNFSK